MLKVAVVGVGAMGRNHARIFAEMPQTHLAAVADLDAEAAAQVARTYKAEAYADFEEMLTIERPDVVSVAVPTRLHRPVAVAALEAGSHVFVEKPLALSVTDGQAILDAARRTGRKLAVGHIERFNPAVVELKRLLDEGQLGRMFQLRSRRVGPFPPRGNAPQHYVMTIIATDLEPDALQPGLSREEVPKALQGGHALRAASAVFRYAH